MIKIDNGLFHYEVTGEREQEAAQELESKLDFISRDYRSMYTAEDIADTRREIANKYDVIIRSAF